MKKIILVILFCFYGICYSQNWVTQYSSNTQCVYDAFFLNASTGWAALDSGFVLKTTNGGQNWVSYNVGSSNSVLKICFTNANTGWAAVYNSQNLGHISNRIYKTTNGGINWSQPNPDFTAGHSQSISALNADTLVMSNATSGKGGGYWGISKSYNGGTIFSALTGRGYAYRTQIINRALWFCHVFKYPPTRYVVMKSTNSGNNWSDFVPNNDTNIFVKDFYFLNQNTGYILSTVDVLYKTMNGGLNWDSTTIPLSGNAKQMQFINESTGWIASSIYTGSYQLGVYKTTNSGASWDSTIINPGLIFTQNLKLNFINESTGWISGGTGYPLGTINKGVIMKTTNGGVTFVNQVPNYTPDNFFLSQNYPNPFNPSTVVSYQLPVAGFVQLKVYDVLGNEIETLVNEKQNAGSYSVDFNAASLPSGIYFYKLVTEKFSETKKMILVK